VARAPTSGAVRCPRRARATVLIAVQPGLGAPATNSRLIGVRGSCSRASATGSTIGSTTVGRRARLLARESAVATASTVSGVTQLNAKSTKRLKAEVDAWAAETRLLVGACRRLVEYFGTNKELKSWDAAIEGPLGCV
jgi:hypothetical protein